jgi:hypothetical protein
VFPEHLVRFQLHSGRNVFLVVSFTWPNRVDSTPLSREQKSTGISSYYFEMI